MSKKIINYKLLEVLKRKMILCDQWGFVFYCSDRGHFEQLGKQISGMHRHVCVHSVLVKTSRVPPLTTRLAHTHAKRKWLCCQWQCQKNKQNRKNKKIKIPMKQFQRTSLFIKRDVWSSECEKTVRPAGRGWIIWAEKSFSSLAED